MNPISQNLEQAQHRHGRINGTMSGSADTDHWSASTEAALASHSPPSPREVQQIVTSLAESDNENSSVTVGLDLSLPLRLPFLISPRTLLPYTMKSSDFPRPRIQ